jgi:hypothetical protein
MEPFPKRRFGVSSGMKCIVVPFQKLWLTASREAKKEVNFFICGSIKVESGNIAKTLVLLPNFFRADSQSFP